MSGDMSKLLDARTAGPWAHDPPGSGTIVSTVYRGRVVAQCDRMEDADAIARSYEEWPGALSDLDIARIERDEARNALEPLRVKLSSLSVMHAKTLGQFNEARSHLMSADDKRAELDHENQLLTDERNAQATRIAELERMLTAWQKHRHSPSLLADWTRYQNQKEKP